MVNYDMNWESHYSDLLFVLSSYLTWEKLVDVTLTAEGKVNHVPRLVLLASSSYFEVSRSL